MSQTELRSGPLAGIRVVELAGLAPGPFAGMLLSDLGAEVLVVDRPEGAGRTPRNLLGRGRRSVAIDLKRPEGVQTVLRLVDLADALIEGFRPGVVERLGIGPEVCLERNPRLVYGRITGWGQDGPLAQAAGHDINYIGLAGVLHHIGPAGGPPVFPLNLLGDFAGGGMLLALGICAALVERSKSGEGQVIDAAMVDGAAILSAMFHTSGGWMMGNQRGLGLLDGGAHFYNVYETKDGGYVAVGSIEPQFYAELLERVGLSSTDLPAQMDTSQWPSLKEKFAALFRTKTRDEWVQALEGTDACFAPVLAMNEAYTHPHNLARGTFVELDGVTQPAPAPRFSRTPGAIHNPPPQAGENPEALVDWGFSKEEVESLREAGIVG